MNKTLPPTNTKYVAVWNAFPPLANWLDSLPEVTTLATIQTWIAKLAEQWAELSRDPKSRVEDEGAASVAECIRETGEQNEHFAGLVSFIESAYGADAGTPKVVDKLIAGMNEHVGELVGLYGPGVPIKQIQTLDVFPGQVQ